MKEITIVISSIDDEKDKIDFINKSLEKIGVEYELSYVRNEGKKSLSEIYGEELEKSKTPYVIFMHDDLEIVNKNWGKKLIEDFEKNPKYGIIGIAGSGTFDSMGAWWRYPDKYGRVMHKTNNQSWLTQFSEDFDGIKEVSVIDGLFMCVKKDMLEESFSPDIKGFNFYDIDFCLANKINGVKIGVTCSVNAIHNSVGELSDEWEENRKIVNEFYEDYYPFKTFNK